MNKLLVTERVLTGTVQPDHPDGIDVITNSCSVFNTSRPRSSLIRQPESLSDLFDGDQDHRNMTHVFYVMFNRTYSRIQRHLYA